MRARAIVAFSAGAGKEVVAYVLDEVMRVWGDPVEVKYGLMGRGACESIQRAPLCNRNGLTGVS